MDCYKIALMQSCNYKPNNAKYCKLGRDIMYLLRRKLNINELKKYLETKGLVDPNYRKNGLKMGFKIIEKKEPVPLEIQKSSLEFKKEIKKNFAPKIITLASLLNKEGKKEEKKEEFKVLNLGDMIKKNDGIKRKGKVIVGKRIPEVAKPVEVKEEPKKEEIKKDEEKPKKEKKMTEAELIECYERGYNNNENYIEQERGTRKWIKEGTCCVFCGWVDCKKHKCEDCTTEIPCESHCPYCPEIGGKYEYCKYHGKSLIRDEIKGHTFVRKQAQYNREKGCYEFKGNNRRYYNADDAFRKEKKEAYEERKKEREQKKQERLYSSTTYWGDNSWQKYTTYNNYNDEAPKQRFWC
jgi:hypothetical protein